MRFFSLMILIGLVQIACGLTTSTPAPAQNSLVALPTATLAQAAALELTIRAEPAAPFNSPGQIIQYTYTLKNIGTTSLPGPITVTGASAACPEIKTVGNLDNNLDVNETLVCTSTYTITQADLDKGSVTNLATASLNGVNSNQATTTLPSTQSLALTLTKTANPAAYAYAGQQVMYTYVITNTSTGTLGPAQFTVTDAGIGTINCGAASISLAPNATVTCSATYTVTQADMGAETVTTSATASGGGMGPTQPVSATLTRNTAVSNPGNLVPGSTIQHPVVAGEWLWQIARCYGADPFKVSAANPPTPSEISPNTTVTVPNIGSVGKIYGPPCIGTYTVLAGDTWEAIAAKYNADTTVLRMVNPVSLTAGQVLKVPLNSADGVKITSNCVDLARSLQFAGAAAASPTHFKLCGPADASGRMNIDTVQIYQRAEEVGPGGLLQEITVSVATSTPQNDPNSLVIGDMNYDGNADFRIIRDLPAGPNIPYLYYLYDPAARKFIYAEAYGKITSPEFPGNNQIRSKWRESAAKWGTDTYQLTNNLPALTQRETWEAVNATQALHRVMVYDAAGTMKVTVEETIPLPTQP